MKREKSYNLTDDPNLELKFAELGFDYKTILPTARFVNDWMVVLTTQNVLKYVGNKSESMLFMFTLVKLGNQQEFCIYQIQAFLFAWLGNANQTRLVISKEYLAPVPSKDRICNDLEYMRPINAALEDLWDYEGYPFRFLLLECFSGDSYLN